MSRAASSKSCPVCGKPPAGDQGPFCSRGCRDRDLLNWLSDGYRVPGPPADDMMETSRSDRLDSDA